MTADESTTTQAAPPERPANSRFRMDNASSATLTLPDGRKLGYAQYGSLSGRAIFYHHGLPGSRIEAAVFDEMTIDPPVRVIAVDRPGYGWSSPHPGRAILDHAKDIEYLANHLKLEDYGVLVRNTPRYLISKRNSLTSGSDRGSREADLMHSLLRLLCPQTSSKVLRSSLAWDRLI